jgi:NADPH:quinone reductase-like Zn-dependent oxidoreductase
MKAVRLLEYGGPLVFTDVPTPTIARDEILVKIKSTAVNHLDLVEASGTVRQILPLRRRHQCRWPPKLRGRESSPTVTWKRDKRS